MAVNLKLSIPKAITDGTYEQQTYDANNNLKKLRNDGTLYLDGPKVLKSGTLGKRNETVYITLVPDNEHQ